MLSANIDGKIRIVFTMSPLITKIATESDLYNVILHMINVTVLMLLHLISQLWVVARVRLDK